MLYDWPDGKSEDFELRYEDRVDFIATGENTGYAVAQVAPNFVGINCVDFYLVRPKKLFLYYGEPNGLADRCHVLSIEAAEITSTLNKLLGVDLGWLALITSAPPASRQLPSNSLDHVQKPGVAFQIFVNANTFPPSPKST
jgi:hypothetical protein